MGRCVCQHNSVAEDREIRKMWFKWLLYLYFWHVILSHPSKLMPLVSVSSETLKVLRCRQRQQQQQQRGGPEGDGQTTDLWHQPQTECLQGHRSHGRHHQEGRIRQRLDVDSEGLLWSRICRRSSSGFPHGAVWQLSN